MAHYDILVAGGGMVGAATANLLAKNGLKVLVVERFDAAKLTFDEHPSLRTSALSRFSISLLEQLGAWQHVDKTRRAPYVGLQTWEEIHNPLKFDAKDANLDYLGHILENNQVQYALWQQFDKFNVTVKTPDSVKSFESQSDKVLVTLQSGEQVSANLLVGADGGNSKIRQMAGIGVDGWQYEQHCMAITVAMLDENPPVTWQEFHVSGPRAYLPLFGPYASLIWYDKAERIAELKKLSLEKLSEQIEQAFPKRLGRFKVLECGSFGLTRMHAKRYFADRVVLVGDAAHTINPLAGQGVNLGFKDVDKLAQCITERLKHSEPYWCGKTLNEYHQARYKHNLLMMSAMDGCYLAFSNDKGPVKLLRNVGLKLANEAGPLKMLVMKYAIGDA